MEGDEIFENYSGSGETNISQTGGIGWTDTEILVISHLWTIVIPVVFSIITLVGITGNSLVIYVILSKREMRTVTNFLLLNLAFADMSFILLVVPYTAVKFAADSWPFGDAFCKIASYFQYVSVYVTVYTLVTISIYRYVTVVWSHATLSYRTKRNAIAVIVTLWSTICCLNIHLLFMHKVKTISVYKYCGQADIDNSYYLYITFFVFAYVVPLALICVLYLLIMIHLRANSLVMARGSAQTQTRDKTSSAFRIVIVVVVVFAVCWLPMHIMFLLAVYKKTPKGLYYEILRVVWHCLAYANSCANPVIYNFTSTNFRKHYREAICSCTSYRRNREMRSSATNWERKQMVTVECNGTTQPSVRVADNEV